MAGGMVFHLYLSIKFSLISFSVSSKKNFFTSFQTMGLSISRGGFTVSHMKSRAGVPGQIKIYQQTAVFQPGQ